MSAPSRSQLASCMGAALCKHLMWDRWCACTNVVGSRNRRPCCITSVGHHDDFQAFGCSNKQNSRKKLSFFQIPNRKDVRIFVGNGSTTSEMQNFSSKLLCQTKCLSSVKTTSYFHDDLLGHWNPGSQTMSRLSSSISLSSSLLQSSSSVNVGSKS